LNENIDWINKGIPILSERLAELERLRIRKPTVREVYYYLVSTKFISNTPSLYKSFDRATVNARKNGFLPENCFVDNSRRIIDIDDDYYPPDQILVVCIQNRFNSVRLILSDSIVIIGNNMRFMSLIYGKRENSIV
jgi:hypothetical protein